PGGRGAHAGGRSGRRAVEAAADVMSLWVKICGITSIEGARGAAEAGVDAVGFVFWPPSPRAVTPKDAARIGAALPPGIERVGVFVDPDQETLARVVEEAGLTAIQLHGSMEPGSLDRLGIEWYPVLSLGPDESAVDTIDRIAALTARRCLIDTKDE